MNPLHKKCIIASSGVHVLLGLILLFGPGFLSSKTKTDNLPVLDFVALKTIDDAMSGGGNPNAKPPPASPPDVKLAPPAPPVRHAPEPEKTEPPKIEDKPHTESLEPAPVHKPRKIEISTTPVKRKPDAQKESKTNSEDPAKERAREMADARRRAADQITRAAARIGSEMSSSTTVELKGPGGGGIPYANFLQAVKSVYTEAWVIPDGITDDDATAAVSVTIARDGTVVSSHITRSSGSPAVDRSVQVTLDRVSYAAPLPEGSESQRTVTISFSVKAKRLLG
jgi:TonB family protein